MKIGFIGLGKWGLNMVQRLLNHGHEVVVWDMSDAVVKEIEKLGAQGALSIHDMITKLPNRKVIWLMVPSGKPVDQNLDALLGLLDENDVIVDGGNSYWKESQERAAKSAEQGIHFLDCGTSGGVWGLKNGYCLMAGGQQEPAKYMESVLTLLLQKMDTFIADLRYGTLGKDGT